MRCKYIITVCAATMFCAGASITQAGTLFVDWSGGGDYLTIQEALTAAQPEDTIVVMPSSGSPAGAYVENIIIPALDITLRSSDPTDPSVVAATIIDGNTNGSVVTFDLNATTDTTLEGFTIRNGEAFAGGGIAAANGSPTIRYCTVTANTAEEGGGMRFWNGSPSVESCTISGNTALSTGGGVSCMGFGAPAVPTFLNCIITGNTADGEYPYGGGIGGSGIDVAVAGGEVSGNVAGSAGCQISAGGGIYIDDGELTIDDCTVRDNVATATQCYGGGISAMNATVTVSTCGITSNSVASSDWYGGGGISCQFGDLTVRDSTISENCANGYPGSLSNGGGGVQVFVGSLNITDCTIVKNKTDQGSGGGLLSEETDGNVRRCMILQNEAQCGAGVLAYVGELVIGNTMILHNIAELDGGGMYVAEATVDVYSTTISGNSTNDMIGFGGAIAAFDGMLTVENSILWGDNAVFGPELLVDTWDVGSEADVYYSDVEGGELAVEVSIDSTLTWGDGNIASDPRFVDSSGPAGNYHLVFDSPCIDAGDPDFLITGDGKDIDGDLRLQGCRLDMGADETFGPTGDVEPDGDVDLADFAEFQRCLGAASGIPGDEVCICKFDFDLSQVVDAEDIAGLIDLLEGPK